MFNMPHTQRSSHRLLAVRGFWGFFALQVSREEYTPPPSVPCPNCPLNKGSQKASVSYTEKVTTSNGHNSYHD